MVPKFLGQWHEEAQTGRDLSQLLPGTCDRAQGFGQPRLEVSCQTEVGSINSLTYCHTTEVEKCLNDAVAQC